jgi:protein-export membrane protein SecD
MTRTDQWKLVVVVVAILAAGWYLYPSYRFYSITPAQRQALPPLELADLRAKAIPLGLDLQGGMHLLLEVDRSRLSPAEAEDAPDRAMEIIRNRVDQFGVAEPLIQREGENRIAVQLPGLTDRDRALELIGKTALLEFQLVRTQQETQDVLTRVDGFLAQRGAGAGVGGDSIAQANPLVSHLVSTGFSVAVRNQELPIVERLLATPGLDSIIPGDSKLAWGERDANLGGVSGRELYVLKKTPEMTGGSVANASAQIGLDERNPGAWGVSLTMSPTGRSQFAQVTGNNVGRQLAIVLDGVVSSAPTINNAIPNGQATITGSFDVESSKSLAIVLRAGALPAPVRIIEERSVGPSLGADSIKRGLQAGAFGAAMVVAFMVVYYQLSGVIAVAALILNVALVAAAMAGFGATLTLPGLAGLALTIGMAVDANVLIFERIREELRARKGVRQAVSVGYDRAFRTILDSNLTTLISALFLFQFGTGPIKGFAVTLSIGLIINMFTAVFFTRMLFDFMLGRRTVERLSI